MKLIVGLGNPGKEYEETRHNMGFKSVDLIASNNGIVFQKEKFGGLYGEGYIEQEKVILLKPQRYINLSGEVIKKFVDFYKIPISDILIISDDLDMDCGRVRIKYKGSSGGHNGLKNIESHLNTQEYKRIKIGISNKKDTETRDYVLGKFNSDEKQQIRVAIQTVADMIPDYLKLTFENVMNKYNK